MFRRREGGITIVEIDESKWGNKRKYNLGTIKCKHINIYIHLNSVTSYSCPSEKSKGKLQ